MEIKKATFIVSNSDYRKCPDTKLPEYAFIGRSNVGKSSLINMLTRNKSLAKTSVDLPGYGYARTSKNSRQLFQKMITDYILHRETLINVFVLIDSRIPPQKIDLDFINFLGTNGIPLNIIFTKTDKPKQRELTQNVNTFLSTLSETWESLPQHFLTSSVTSFGRDNLLSHIDQINHSLANQ